VYVAVGKCIKERRKESEMGVGKSTTQRNATIPCPVTLKQMRKEMKTKNYVRRAVIAFRARDIARRAIRAVVAGRARDKAG